MSKERTLDEIRNKKNDYKICEECGEINWYENKYCENCNSEKFNESIGRVNDYIYKEYKFYIETMDFTEKRADTLIKEV